LLLLLLLHCCCHTVYHLQGIVPQIIPWYLLQLQSLLLLLLPPKYPEVGSACKVESSINFSHPHGVVPQIMP
jgi:hypothetical protein